MVRSVMIRILRSPRCPAGTIRSGHPGTPRRPTRTVGAVGRTRAPWPSGTSRPSGSTGSGRAATAWVRPGARVLPSGTAGDGVASERIASERGRCSHKVGGTAGGGTAVPAVTGGTTIPAFCSIRTGAAITARTTNARACSVPSRFAGRAPKTTGASAGSRPARGARRAGSAGSAIVSAASGSRVAREQ